VTALYFKDSLCVGDDSCAPIRGAASGARTATSVSLGDRTRAASSHWWSESGCASTQRPTVTTTSSRSCDGAVIVVIVVIDRQLQQQQQQWRRPVDVHTSIQTLEDRFKNGQLEADL